MFVSSLTDTTYCSVCPHPNAKVQKIFGTDNFYCFFLLVWLKILKRRKTAQPNAEAIKAIFQAPHKCRKPVLVQDRLLMSVWNSGLLVGLSVGLLSLLGVNLGREN